MSDNKYLCESCEYNLHMFSKEYKCNENIVIILTGRVECESNNYVRERAAKKKTCLNYKPIDTTP